MITLVLVVVVFFKGVGYGSEGTTAEGLPHAGIVPLGYGGQEPGSVSQVGRDRLKGSAPMFDFDQILPTDFKD